MTSLFDLLKIEKIVPINDSDLFSAQNNMETSNCKLSFAGFSVFDDTEPENSPIGTLPRLTEQ